MKIFTNKNIVQKIIIAILIVLSFNFITPTYSQAGFGGVLAGPIIDLFAGLGDVVMSFLQFFFYDGGFTVGDTADISSGFNQFMLAGSKADEDTIKKFGMEPTKSTPDIIIDANLFDKGWRSVLTIGFLEKDFGIPVIKYTPEAIFSNEVPALDVNFINPTDWTKKSGVTDGAAMNEKSVTIALHSTIANWYIALRNLAIVALLSVLLYVGIRMVISSTASDKAKYKQMLMDWIVALCIVFFLHYIMSFILTVTDMITQGLSASSAITVQVQNAQLSNGDTTVDFNTDLTGLCRLQLQYEELSARWIYLIFYIALVIYTCMFTWTYVKRAINMAFLTLMAPLVAITYPIDKISDGKAQAYGIWLKEYIFNALLQPFHLIIYTIFLGSSIEIAVENPIYAILFLAFIIPSEKLLRKMFGFEKSSTAGAFAAGVGGAAAFKMLSNVVGKGGSKKGGAGKTQDKVRTKDQIKDKNEIGKDYSAFAPRNGVGTNGNEAPASLSAEESEEMNGLRAELDNTDYNDMYLNPSAYQAKQDRLAELEARHNRVRESAQGQQAQETTGGYEMIRRANSNNMGIHNTEANGNFENLGEAGDSSVSKSIIRGVKNVAASGVKYTGNKLKHRFASKEGWKENARFAGRTAVRGLSAATFGAVGLGMGIAGNDLEDVLKYGMAGATLGGTVVGGRLADAGGRVMHNANTAFQEGYYGDKNAAIMAQQYNQFYNDDDKRDFFGEEFEVKGEELDSIMGRAAEINNQGITDNKAIKQTIKLEDSIRKEMSARGANDEESARTAKEQAITIAKIADNYNTEKLRTDERYRNGVYDDFERGLKKSNPEISKEELGKQKEYMMKLLKQYKKID